VDHLSVRWDAACKVYPGGVLALDTLTLETREGEVLALVGRSGSGKTTALKLVNRLLEPTSGRVIVGGRDVRELDPVELRRGLGTVLARAGLLPHLTVAANVELLPHVLGWKRAAMRRSSDELLARLGLEPATYRDRYPDELSTGEQQRVALARALVLDPKILLLDEPTSALDPVTRRRFQDELAKLRGRTVVLVTHDIDEARRLADRIAVLDQGKLVQVGAPEDLRLRPATTLVRSLLERRAA
jgi:osmoprotectant transport system ATP-binding protein